MNKHSNANDSAPRHAVPLPPMLFDLDGTLVDSAYQHVLAWHETFTDFRMDTRTTTAALAHHAKANQQTRTVSSQVHFTPPA